MATTQITTCHLLNLPAELRNRIYEACLSPGVLCLTRTDTKRFAVSPSISPCILATCRQIYNEASKLLYFDNEVTLIMDIHDTFAPVINESRLPQRALENLEHVCLICDGTANLQASYEDVDFTHLSALVSLKTLRICVILSIIPQISPEVVLLQTTGLVEQILERVPASTRILYEVVPGSPQEKLAQYVLAKGMERHSRGRAGRSFAANTASNGGSFLRTTYILPSSTIEKSVEAAEAEHDLRGRKSGTGLDVFAEHRAELKGFAWRS